MYQMKSEIISNLRKVTKLASSTKTSEIKQIIIELEAAMNQVADAGIDNQDKLIEESLTVMSELQECEELRKHL